MIHSSYSIPSTLFSSGYIFIPPPLHFAGQWAFTNVLSAWNTLPSPLCQANSLSGFHLLLTSLKWFSVPSVIPVFMELVPFASLINLINLLYIVYGRSLFLWKGSKLKEWAFKGLLCMINLYFDVNRVKRKPALKMA